MTEIDDEMVERACRYYYGENKNQWHQGHMRGILEAALSPPKPEIEVTEAMLDAGNDAWNGVVKAPECLAARTPQYDAIMRAVHRAMVKAAPDGAKDAPQGVSSGAPVNETGGKFQTKFYGINRL